MNEEHVLRGEERWSQTKTVFRVETNALHYAQAPSKYQRDIRVKSLIHRSIAERATHFG